MAGTANYSFLAWIIGLGPLYGLDEPVEPAPSSLFSLEQRRSEVHYVVRQRRKQRHAGDFSQAPNRELPQPAMSLEVRVDGLTQGGPFLIDLFGLRRPHPRSPLRHVGPIALLGLGRVHPLGLGRRGVELHLGARRFDALQM